MKKLFLFSLIALLALPADANEYIDPETNVIYVYKQGIPNATVKSGDVAEWDSGDIEYVSGNPDAKGDVRILDRFTVNGEEYVVNSVGGLAFASNKDITSVFLPSTIETIGAESFLGCSSLETISLSEGLKAIDYRAFSGCVSLSSLVLPEGLERIGIGAFTLCTALQSVCIPSSVTTIDRSPFLECDNLESVSVAEGNKFFDSREGCNAVIEKATNRLILGCKTTVIPFTVISVGDNAFSGCRSLEKIVIPESVKTIESNAFFRCEDLSEVTLPHNLQSIGESAFAQTAIKSITIPSDIKSIGFWAFSSSNLETVYSFIKEPFAVPDLCNFPSPNPILFVPAGTKEKYKATKKWDRFKDIIELGEAEKRCATPTIAYAGGRLVFGCETEGAECVYEIKCADGGSGRGGEVSLSRTYEISVRATLDGYEDSDTATATIGWRDGQPVMEGFSSITMDGTDERGDMNYDGKIDVADIAKILSMMAGTSAKQAP